MNQYTRHLLAFSLVVISAVLANPCLAQTVDSKDDITNDTSSTLQPIANSDNLSKNKSELPSSNVSQANSEKTTVSDPNPRIPIYSRIFQTMQQ
jgi:hypothetical protein